MILFFIILNRADNFISNKIEVSVLMIYLGIAMIFFGVFKFLQTFKVEQN